MPCSVVTALQRPNNSFKPSPLRGLGAAFGGTQRAGLTQALGPLMARGTSQATESEYGELKKFFVHWETHLNPIRIFPIDNPHNAINVLAGIELQLGVSKALSGLKQAINDVLESVPDYTPEFRAMADESLASVGALTLTQLWHRRSAQFNRILRRGELRNDIEYYLVSSVLADDSCDLPSHELEALNNMTAKYESRRA